MMLDDDYYDTCDRLEAEQEAKMAAFVSDFRHKLRNGSWAANQRMNEMHEDLDGDPLWTIVEKYCDDPAKLGPELIALLEDRLHEMAKEEV